MWELAFLTGLLLAAVWTDVRIHKIRNWATLGGSLLALLLQGMLHGWDGVLAALAGLAVGYAAFLPGYFLGAVGAGDVKLMGMVGAFLGPAGGLTAVVGTMLLGGLIALVLVLLRGGAAPWRRYRDMFGASLLLRRFSYAPPAPDEAVAFRFPFAPVIALGTLAALAWTGRLSGIV